MPDEITPGELDRRIQSHEQRTDRIHGELDNRITRVAAEAVQADVHDRIERDRDREIAKLDRRVEDLEKRPVPRPMTFGKWMALLGVVIAFIGVLLTAYSMSQGAK